jgi:hypothetical protein
MLKGGSAGRAKMAVGATGSVLGDPGLPIPMEDVPLRMQLLNRETAACWESVFTASDVVVNDGRRFKARTD